MRFACRSVAAALALLLAAAAPPAGLSPVAVTARPVPLDPANPATAEAGRLRYLGGLDLTSPDPRFGGVSGLRWWGGALLAVTDGGSWLRIVTAEDGDRLTGVVSAAMGMIRGPGRETFRGRGHIDAEALDVDAAGGLTVAFEGEPRIWSYRNLADAAWSIDFADPRWLQSLPRNGGIAAIAGSGAAGWRLYLAESPTGDGRQEGLLSATRGLDRTFARVMVPTLPGFRPTDAVVLDSAHVILLSRRMDRAKGEVEAALDIVPVDARGLTLGTPRPLARLAAPLSIDNMEGLALRREGGRLFLYIVSDDNFSPLQRTLLLKFEVLP